MNEIMNELSEHFKRDAQRSKANHIANWCCAQFPHEEYVTAVIAAITLVSDKDNWKGVASGSRRDGSSEEVRIMVLEELRRRIGPGTVPQWSLAPQKVESDPFEGLPKD